MALRVVSGMSGFAPLLGEKQTSDAPTPGADFMSTRPGQTVHSAELHGDQSRSEGPGRGPFLASTEHGVLDFRLLGLFRLCLFARQPLGL